MSALLRPLARDGIVGGVVIKLLARGGAATLGAAALLALFGSGSAGAVNEYEGQTYGDAASSISGSGARPVIATRVGEYLPLAQCLVTGSRSTGFLNSSGQAGGSTVLLDINCGYPFAYNGKPGFSRQSQEGGAAYQQALEAAQQQQQQQEEAAAAAAGGSAASGG